MTLSVRFIGLLVLFTTGAGALLCHAGRYGEMNEFAPALSDVTPRLAEREDITRHLQPLDLRSYDTITEETSLEDLIAMRLNDPPANAPNITKFISQSTDFSVYGPIFTKTAEDLISSRKCTVKDFERTIGWIKSPEQSEEPMYFVYCGGLTRSSRIYLNASTGTLFQWSPPV